MIKRNPIKVILGSFALLGFLGIILFWSAGMHQGNKHNCISAAVQNTVCPNAATSEAAVFHLPTLQSFMANVLQMSQLSAVLLALAFVVLAAVAGIAGDFAPGVFVHRNVTSAIAPLGEYRRWLSLFEHSPSFQPGRV